MSLPDLEVRTEGRMLVAAVKGEIDMSNADGLGSAISRQISNDALGLVLDLSGVEYLDSAALQMLFEVRRHLATRGQAMRLVVPAGAMIAPALEIVDIPGTIGVEETPEAALESLIEAIPEARGAEPPIQEPEH
jgi:anti-anti-sigma factor